MMPLGINNYMPAAIHHVRHMMNCRPAFSSQMMPLGINNYMPAAIHHVRCRAELC